MQRMCLPKCLREQNPDRIANSTQSRGGFIDTPKQRGERNQCTVWVDSFDFHWTHCTQAYALRYSYIPFRNEYLVLYNSTCTHHMQALICQSHRRHRRQRTILNTERGSQPEASLSRHQHKSLIDSETRKSTQGR